MSRCGLKADLAIPARLCQALNLASRFFPAPNSWAREPTAMRWFVCGEALGFKTR